MKTMLFHICLIVCFMVAVITPTAMAQVVLNGAGATFPSPLYGKWIEIYQQQAHARLAYQAIGSGGGIKALLERRVDFGATDAILSNRDLKAAANKILHVPTCLSAVAVIYNLPVSLALRLGPEILAAIFTGKISRWSDPRLLKTNAGLKLPDLPITIVHRSDSSGTTFVFSDYLSKTCPVWHVSMGCGKLLAWPTGIGLEGNPGVAEYVKKISGSIGYVSLNFAKQEQLPTVLVKNRCGNFIAPDLESVSRAASTEIPDDMRVMITDSSSPWGYPISAFSYLIVYQEQAYKQRNRERAEVLVRFLRWTIHQGQQYNASLYYAKLPEMVVQKAEKVICSMVYGGIPLCSE